MQFITRRELICRSGSVALLAAGSVGAQAQGTTDWPTKPVRLIVNYAPGGGADNSTRPFADRLSRTVGQQFFIDNKAAPQAPSASRRPSSRRPTATPFSPHHP